MADPDSSNADHQQWFVLRDLKRSNSNSPAYKTLPEMGVEIFTPMHWVIKVNQKGKRVRRYVPFIQSLLFAKSDRQALDPIIEMTETLQYRFVKGAPQNTPMIVPTKDMERFIRAVQGAVDVSYHSPSEITPDMIGKKVMVMGGGLEGVTGKLLKTRGSKKKKVVVSIEGLISAIVEVEKDYIKLL